MHEVAYPLRPLPATPKKQDLGTSLVLFKIWTRAPTSSFIYESVPRDLIDDSRS